MDFITDIGSSWPMNKWWFKGQILEEVEYIFSQFPQGTAENFVRLKCRTKIYDFQTKIESRGLQEISNAHGIKVVNFDRKTLWRESQ